MKESSDSPLVLTKLRPPALRLRDISRRQLLDRLTPISKPDLVLICAPAGYGKTTLLAERARSFQEKGAAVIWYALDASDDEPLHFASYLVAGFTQAFGSTPDLADTARLLRSSHEVAIQKILPVMINTVLASERECFLFLDDYHLISSPAIHSAIAYLIEHLPQNMRVFLGSRSDPPLSLARLRARGQLLEIRAADLRFNPDEAARYLNEVMQLDLSAEMVATLEARTEGWVAGLQLAALSLSGRSDKASYISAFTGSHRYLVDYLLDEVFNCQSTEVQSFLLSTAVLERMCAPLCEAIVTHSDARIGSEPETSLSAQKPRSASIHP